MKLIKKQICKRGHDTFIVGRYAGGHCRSCAAIDVQKRRQRDPEHFRRIRRESTRKWTRTHFAQYKANVWKGYGILNEEKQPFTLIDYNRFYQGQYGHCAICRRHSTEFKQALAVDHDHKTHIVRGLLCSACNVDLGRYENIEWQNLAKQYLKESTEILDEERGNAYKDD